VISTQFCQKGLTDGEEDKFDVTPKVLCVAFNHTYHTKFYREEGDKLADSSIFFATNAKLSNISIDRYVKMKQSRSLRSLLGRKENWYIIGTGKLSVTFKASFSCPSIFFLGEDLFLPFPSFSC